MSATAQEAQPSKSQKKKAKKKAAAERRAQAADLGAARGESASPAVSSPATVSGSSTPSRSGLLRQKGNRLLQSIKDLQPGPRTRALHEVEELYKRALDAAADPAEQAACHKNLASCHVQVAYLEDEVHHRDEEACQAVMRAITAYTEAFQVGQACQAPEWLQDIYSRRVRALEYGRDICLTSGDAATLLTYHSRLLRCVPDHYSDQRAQIAGYVAQDLFRAGVICLEVEDPLTALRFFNAASRPLTEAEQAGIEAEEFRDWCKQRREDLHQHHCIASSALETSNAERLVNTSLQDSEDWPLDALWSAADMYRSAMVLTRGHDIVGEAKAASRLGMLYCVVLADKARGMPLLRSCLQLAHTLVPVPTSADWFKAARDHIQQEQRTVRKRDDQDWQEAKGPILHALKPELSACKRAADRGFKALIHHIFTEHPSRVPGAKADIPDCSPDNWKSALQTALRHYHPDHNATDPDDTWFVLCEEITKLINIQYSKLK